MADGAVSGPSKSQKKKDKTKEGVLLPSPHDEHQDAAGGKVKKVVEAAKPKKKKQPESNKSEESANEGQVVNVRQCRLGLIIGHQIGSGSFAKVYKAYSCQKQKDVAVKIFKRSDIPENYFNKFIVREIEVIKELRHRNLVKFYDCQFTTKR